MTLIEAIRTFIRSKPEPVHLQDLYAHLPEEHQHSIRARVYENLGKHFRRVGKGLYVAVDGEAACVVVHGDAWEEVKKLGTQSIDAFITDPSYDWLDHFVDQGTTRKRMAWDFERRDIDRELGLEIFRVLKEGAWAFFIVPAETATTRPHIQRLIGLLESAGLVFQKTWVWHKVTLGMGYAGRGTYEGIIAMTRGLEKRQPCDFSVADVFTEPLIAPTKRKHPTEKPVGLLKALIRFATKIGETVLDCFAGSLSTGRAALSLGRNAILIEKNERLLSLALEE